MHRVGGRTRLPISLNSRLQSIEFSDLIKMVVDLKFSRFSEEPWGFRLTGGTDFEFPLTVIKVSGTVKYFK